MILSRYHTSSAIQRTSPNISFWRVLENNLYVMMYLVSIFNVHMSIIS
jgi:hypothetical protein